MILLYHKVFPEALTHWWVDIDSFYCQMMDLQSKKVVFLDEYDSNDPSHAVITFDGVYQNVLQYAAPILRKFRYPYELFITGDYVGKGNEFDSVEPHALFASCDELKQLVSCGGRLQWHTHSHPDMRTLSLKEQIVTELEVPQELLDLDPSGFKWFAYPHGEFTDEVISEVRQRYAGALSCIQGDSINVYKLNREIVVNDTSFRKASIGVVIVSYNYGCFLSEAVESVLSQTRIPDRVLIMDDCSSDNTSEVGMHYQDLYPDYVTFFRNEKNLGIVATFNRAVEKIGTDYICFLGADNRFQSNYIESTSSVLDKSDSDVAIAYTDYILFGDRAALEYSRHDPSRLGGMKGESGYLISFPEKPTADLSRCNYIHGSSMYKKEAFESVGGYIEQPNKPEDHNLFVRILRKGWSAKKAQGAYLDYRQHSYEQANTKINMIKEIEFNRIYIKRLKWQLKFLEEVYQKFGFIVRVASRLERLIVRLVLRIKQ